MVGFSLTSCAIARGYPFTRSRLADELDVVRMALSEIAEIEYATKAMPLQAAGDLDLARPRTLLHPGDVAKRMVCDVRDRESDISVGANHSDRDPVIRAKVLWRYEPIDRAARC